MITAFFIKSGVYDTTVGTWNGAPRKELYRSFNEAESEIERICCEHDDRHPSEYEIHADDGSRYTWGGDENWFVLAPGTAGSRLGSLYGFTKGQRVKLLVDFVAIDNEGVKRTVPAGSIGVVDPKRTWPPLLVEIDSTMSVTYTEADGPVGGFLVAMPAAPEKIYRPAKGLDFVGVPTPTMIFCGVKNRGDFDKIDAPLMDSGLGENGHVLTKCVGEGKFTIIVQHWLIERDYVAEKVAAMKSEANAAT